MIALGITLASVAVYFAIGFLLAVRDMPNMWERARRQWKYDDTTRSAVNGGTALTFLFWPFRWPFVILANMANQRDPKRLEEQLREQERQIADLERELRIGRDR